MSWRMVPKDQSSETLFVYSFGYMIKEEKRRYFMP